MRRLSPGLLAAAACVVIGGCGYDAPGGEAPDEVLGDPLLVVPFERLLPEPNGDVFVVQALDNVFRQQEISITPGTEVRWENVGRTDHNVLSIEAADGWGVAESDFAPGTEYSYVFREPGEFRYYCSLHGNADIGMIGTVVVTEA